MDEKSHQQESRMNVVTHLKNEEQQGVRRFIPRNERNNGREERSQHKLVPDEFRAPTYAGITKLMVGRRINADNRAPGQKTGRALTNSCGWDPKE